MGNKGTAEVKAHRWLSDMKWSRLLEGEIESPLRHPAEEMLAQQLVLGIGAPLPEEPPVEGADLSWLDAFSMVTVPPMGTVVNISDSPSTAIAE